MIYNAYSTGDRSPTMFVRKAPEVQKSTNQIFYQKRFSQNYVGLFGHVFLIHITIVLTTRPRLNSEFSIHIKNK